MPELTNEPTTATNTVGIAFIVDYLLTKRPDLDSIDPDLDLIESRVLDSLGFVNFLYALEEHTGREISLDQVSPEDFRTVNRIAARFLHDVAND
ncbi:acyl carrier protein [Actinomadura rudentiformis]|uniref:Acyl carrier protein n=1 Tax=Actinomadura rudentiformis TaxID=359158 RepID=A0A6H9YM82_9ACTN|nr:phosphopantetheine-binding protein [Actinomadura rudentiformis]KAB2342450.1 acyl carrier protein [Actinomadura rudentiformis]